MDYREWVNDVKAFSESLSRVPGELDLTVEIDPTLTAEELEFIAAKWSVPVPSPLQRLWLEGSSRLNCTYVWTPTDVELPKLGEIFESNEYYIYGGVSFEPAQDVFPGNSGIDINDEYTAKWVKKNDLATWCTSAVFLYMMNGDALALDLSTSLDDPAVVYLDHEDGTASCLARSFTQFIRDWARLCYLGPEIWLLREWIDKDTGYINSNSEKTTLLRQLLSPRI